MRCLLFPPSSLLPSDDDVLAHASILELKHLRARQFQLSLLTARLHRRPLMSCGAAQISTVCFNISGFTRFLYFWGYTQPMQISVQLLFILQCYRVIRRLLRNRSSFLCQSRWDMSHINGWNGLWQAILSAHIYHLVKHHSSTTTLQLFRGYKPDKIPVLFFGRKPYVTLVHNKLHLLCF